MSGTRKPYSYEFKIGGATLSNQPPQSSQVIRIAVLSQYLLVPMALTTDATHEGPWPRLVLGWSDACPRVITQLTAGSLPCAMSVRMVVSGVMTLAQSGPRRMCSIAFG